MLPLLLIALAGGCYGIAQSSSAAESTQRLVKLNVAAVNAKGEPVTDLEAAEIQVREDGKVRPPVFFRFAGSKRPLAPPVAGQTANRPSSPPTLILLDRWNERMMTTASAWLDINKALQHLESVDRIYIYLLTNSGELFPVHPLPPVDAALRTAAEPTAAEIIAKLDAAVRKFQGFRNVDALDPGLRVNATLHALDTLGQQMSWIAGRKNLIWVTHGFPLIARLPSRDWADFTPQVRSLSAGAVRNEIAIYPVDQSAAGAGANPANMSTATLQMFANLTGGRWFASGNADRAIADTMVDSIGNYRIAYDSPVHENDRKEHKIRLDSTRKGVRLFTREGYFEGDEPDPDTVEQAFLGSERRSPFDAGDIGLRVAFSRNAKVVHFDVRVDPSDILMEHRNGSYQGRLTLLFAYYSEGVPKDVTAPVHKDINLTQEQFDRAQKDGLTVSEDVPASDKADKFRVIVFDRGLQTLGSVTMPTQ